MLIRDMPGSTWVVSGSLLVQACSLHQPHKCFHYFWHWWTEFRFRLQLRYNHTHHVSKSWNEVCTNVQQVPAHPIAPSFVHTSPPTALHRSGFRGAWSMLYTHSNANLNQSFHPFPWWHFSRTTWTIQIKLHCSTTYYVLQKNCLFSSSYGGMTNAGNLPVHTTQWYQQTVIEILQDTFPSMQGPPFSPVHQCHVAEEWPTSRVTALILSLCWRGRKTHCHAWVF